MPLLRRPPSRRSLRWRYRQGSVGTDRPVLLRTGPVPAWRAAPSGGWPPRRSGIQPSMLIRSDRTGGEVGRVTAGPEPRDGSYDRALSHPSSDTSATSTISPRRPKAHTPRSSATAVRSCTASGSSSASRAHPRLAACAGTTPLCRVRDRAGQYQDVSQPRACLGEASQVVSKQLPWWRLPRSPT